MNTHTHTQDYYRSVSVCQLNSVFGGGGLRGGRGVERGEGGYRGERGVIEWGGGL